MDGLDGLDGLDGMGWYPGGRGYRAPYGAKNKNTDTSIGLVKSILIICEM